MALTQSQAQILANVRQFANAAGTTALLRHTDASVYDYINRALGSLHRRLTEAGVGDRYLASTTVTTSAGTSTYALPADFDHLLLVDLTANGAKTWLVAYELHERPILTGPFSSYTGVPYTYRLQGSNIEYLPVPSTAYTSTLWYTPRPTSWATNGSDSASVFDTVNRLDDYLIAYAARFIAIRDKDDQLKQHCEAMLEEVGGELAAIGRSRDRNSPPRPVDEYLTNRFGRRVRMPRNWR